MEAILAEEEDRGNDLGTLLESLGKDEHDKADRR